MKNLIIILLPLFLFSCTGDVTVSPGPGPLVQQDESEEKPESLANPGFMLGTDFGNLFKTLYAQGKFEDMILFTSKESIDKFGRDKLLDFYENDLRFGYELGKPHSQTVSGDTITLNYNASIIATKKVVRLSVVVENDTCKVVLPNDLKSFTR